MTNTKQKKQKNNNKKRFLGHLQYEHCFRELKPIQTGISKSIKETKSEKKNKNNNNKKTHEYQPTD